MPWADALFAADAQWWQHYREAASGFAGERWSASTVPGVRKLRLAFHNSGAGSIELAAHSGASRILLLGFDCKHRGGRAHWHADHPAPMGNAGSVDQWPALFRATAAAVAGVEVLNCSRSTAIDCFPRMRLEDALAHPGHEGTGRQHLPAGLPKGS